MTDQSSISHQMTLWDIRSVTSSPESEDGITLFASPDGGAGRHGRALAPVSPSVAPAKPGASPILVTYGQRGFGSSASAALQWSLESRLRQRLGSRGSILFQLTWKRRVTPSGRRILQRRALALRSYDRDYSGWPRMPSPTACDGKGSGTKRIRPRGLNLRDWFNHKYDFRYPPALIVCVMMGFPAAVLSCADSATRSSLKSRRSSSARTAKRED